MPAGTSVWKEEHDLLYKVPSLAYASYVCLNLYGVVLHFHGYATCFENVMICNDEYYMQNAGIVELCGIPSKVGLCGCQGRLDFGGMPIKLGFKGEMLIRIGVWLF